MTNLERMLELKRQGFKNKQIASELGVTKNTVIGALWRHKRSMNAVIPKNVIPLYPSLPKPKVITRADNEDTDMDTWLMRRDTLLKTLSHIRVMHLNDLHLPYHDSEALSLWIEIARRFRPHVVALGSDMNDYPNLSRFEPDADIKVDDWQEETREYYWPIVHQLDRLLPLAWFVYFLGNHERRAVNAIKTSDSPKVGMAYFIETIRCGGRVLYMGRTEHIEVGSLIVAHGNKAGKYAAANIGAQWPDKVVNFGHIHKHQKIGNAFSNGMLCQMIPHYDDWGYPNNQEQGTSTITVDTQGGVSWSHHNFVQSSSGLWTQYGNEVIEVKKQAMAESEAA
jgi:hypothetical protein